MGVALLSGQVIEAKLPQRVSRLRRVEKPLDPYACLAIRPHRCAPVRQVHQSGGSAPRAGPAGVCEEG